MALVNSGSVAPSYPRAQNTSRARSSASSTSNCRVRPEGMATSWQKKMLSALDRRFAGPYTFIVPNGTRNSSEEITMSRTIKFTKAGGPEVLEFIETKVKAPGPHEVRIKVKAIGINRAESMWRNDKYIEPVKFPAGLGYDSA